MIFYALAAFLIPFGFYLYTLAPSVTFIDSGELATVATKLGVAHPTGYPLFTLIGSLFSKLPFGEEIYMLNMMSAFISSLAVFMFFLLSFALLRRLQEDKADEMIILNIALASSLVLAFSRTFWDTANAIEVYSLHSFFIVANLLLILKASGEINLTDQMPRQRFWLAFAFVLGLSFTNHLSTVFLSIGCLYLYFATSGFGKQSFERILLMAIPFFLGLSVYVYLFVRADNTVMSWGHPHNFENFWRHFTGKQFSVWMFSSFDNAEKQFSYFTKNYPMEFMILPVLAAIPGLFILYGRARRIFNFTLLLFLFCIIYAINYDIYDIDSYFLLAFIVTAVWTACGLLWMSEKLKGNKASLSYAFLLLPILPLAANFEKNDESKNRFVDEYTLNVFNSAPQNSILFSTQWDFWISSSMYQQMVRGIRPDIAVIDKELLRKSWYFKYIKDHYPDIYANSKAEIDAYFNELVKFEDNTGRYTSPKTETDRLDLQRIQSTFLALLNSFVDKNYPQRPFLTTLEVEQEKNEKFGKDYQRIPVGLLFKYTKDGTADSSSVPDFKFTATDKKDYHHSFLMNAYYSAYLNRANYLINVSRFDEAEAILSKASELKPGSPEITQLMSKIGQLKSLQNNMLNQR